MRAKITEDQLRLRISGHFWRMAARLSKRRARETFADIHSVRRSSDTHIARVSLGVGAKEAIVDYTIFEYECPPSFLERSLLMENRYGLVLIVQYDGYACVHTAGGASFADRYLTDLGSRVGQDAIAEVVGGAEKIRQISARSMSAGPNAIRARMLMADDLGRSVPPMMLHREMLTSVRTQQDGATRTARPSTALLTKGAPPSTLDAFVQWVAESVEALQTKASQPAGTGTPLFLRYFAQAVKNEDLPGGVRPTAVHLDLARVEEGIAEGTLGVFLKRGAAPLLQIPDELVLAAIPILSEPGTVASPAIGARTATVRFDGFVPEFTLQTNKKSYSLACHALRDVRIGDRDGTELHTLTQWVGETENEALTVSLSDVRYAFIHGQLVRDEHIMAQAPLLLDCLHAVPALGACTSEKGDTFTPRSTAFSPGSVFAAIEGVVAAEPMLVCDDLGDEWADYIGIDPSAHTITLYHAKHGSRTASASAFQTVLGQAVKNLGRVGSVRADLQAKRQTWAQRYRAESTTTRIARIRRGGTAAKVADAYAEVVDRATCRARVALVTSFLSKAEIEQTVVLLQRGQALHRQDPQRLRLIASFVGECRQANAEAVIYCAP